jgi:hypothetical protein
MSWPISLLVTLAAIPHLPPPVAPRGQSGRLVPPAPQIPYLFFYRCQQLVRRNGDIEYYREGSQLAPTQKDNVVRKVFLIACEKS